MIGFINHFNSHFPFFAIIFCCTSFIAWERSSMWEVGQLSFLTDFSFPSSDQTPQKQVTGLWDPPSTNISSFSFAFRRPSSWPFLSFLPYILGNPGGLTVREFHQQVVQLSQYGYLVWNLADRTTFIGILAMESGVQLVLAYCVGQVLWVLNLLGFILMAMLGRSWIYTRYIDKKTEA